MLELSFFVIGFFIGLIFQYFFPVIGTALDFIQEHRPKEKVIHDVEIVKKPL